MPGMSAFEFMLWTAKSADVTKIWHDTITDRTLARWERNKAQLLELFWKVDEIGGCIVISPVTQQ